MRTLYILNIFFTFTAFSQIKVDTMFIGNIKIPLEKTKLFFSYQTGPVFIKSEYKDINNYKNKKQIPYSHISDTVIENVLDNEGNIYTIKKVEHICDTSTNNNINLYSLVDTVIVSPQEIHKLRPYIKSGKNKYYFCAAKLQSIENSLLTVSKCSFSNNGYIVDHMRTYNDKIDDEELNIRLKTIYVLDNFYYIKNNVTYFLNRQFLIKIINYR